MICLPQGNVTYLFTDVVGSSRMWEQAPEQMRATLQRHDLLISSATAERGGTVVRSRGEGDSFFCVFTDASQAVAAAAAIQLAVHREPWPEETPIRLRAALHTGAADQRDGDYYGNTVNRCARMRGVAHPGQTLLSSATRDLVGEPPGGITFRSLGMHRFRDLQRPEHLFQLEHPELPAEFPPLNSLGAFRHNLPVQTTSFVSRELELEEVRRLLAETRLLTVHGPGGSGKTRLALQVAGEMLEEYVDGVWFVELDRINDSSRVLQEAADTLGVSEEPKDALAETLSYFLHARSALLVLDNCEHVVDGAAQLSNRLLRSCPGLTILATSQKSLGIPGEMIWDIPTLSVPRPESFPGGTDLARELERFGAPRLFLERARLVRPDFALTPQQSEAVIRICERLDGIPLAIELAAPWVRTLSPEQIAELLDDSFRMLIRGARTAPTRHQTLAAAIDWSCGHLSPAERVLLHRVSVFAGSWTLEAAQEVCSGSPTPDGPALGPFEVMELLLELVDKSLVAAAEDERGERRYRLLETVRQFGCARLSGTAEERWLFGRHRDFFLLFAEETEPKLQGPEQAVWFARVAADYENLRDALAWCEREGDVEAGLRLASALWWFWYARGQVAEGLRWLEKAETASGIDPAVHARAHTRAGTLARARGFTERAEWLYRRGLSLRRSLGDEPGVASLLNNLALLARDVGDLDAAQAYLEEALALYRRGPLASELAAVLTNLGCLAMERGELDLAGDKLRESLEMYRSLENELGVGNCLRNLADLALARGELQPAHRLAIEALEIALSLSNTPGVLYSIELLCRIAELNEQLALAARLRSSLDAHYEELGSRMPPADQQRAAAQRANLQTRLGAKRFVELCGEGEALTWKQLLELARDQPELTCQTPANIIG